MAAVPDVLVEFVRSCLERGVSRPAIVRALEDAGWSPREAATAIDAFGESSLPVPVPRKRVSSSPRDAFLSLLSLAMLYNAAVAVGTILFVLIERGFPAPGDAKGLQLGVLRWAAAALIVSLPILMLVRRAIDQDLARNPLARMAPVYRTLASLTVLLATLVVVGDLICVLITFLSGDVTTRFVLKATVLLVICGAIYACFSTDVSRDESRDRLGRTAGAAVLPTQPAWRGWLARVAVVASLAALLAALSLIGDPARARMLRLDARRVDDLREIRSSIERFHARQGALPASLDELARDPETFVSSRKDPVDNTPYAYRRLGERAYELSANFALPSPEASDRDRGQDDEFFTHGPGEVTFRISMPGEEAVGSHPPE